MQQDPSQQPAMPPYAPYAQPVPPAPAPSGTSKAKVWGAIAAGVSAVAAVASAIAAFTNSPSAGPSAPAVPQPAPASTVGAQPPAAKPGTGAAGAGTVRWSGRVVLGLEGLDLSQVPPRTASGLGARPAAARSGSSSMMVKGTAVLWTAAEAPTAQGCKDLLATQSRKEVVVAEGDSVCLVDENSPIAVLKVTRTSYEEGSYGLIEGDLTTWNLRADR
ncbi:hypothetical protein WDV06_01375 [Streptomyces racemochromogenes]|uniref:Serine/threonine protein kinase n=1 Tax=Streptomyces racemochromogenes TaxID=67353 RepID=A0ABW7P6L4_9ACTN